MHRYIVVILILFITGCGGCENDKPIKKIVLTPEAKKAEIKFLRFDDDLFHADFSNPAASQQLYQKYGRFFCRFVENDLLLAECQSDSVGALLIPFVRNRDIIETRKEIEKHFPKEKIEVLNQLLTETFRRWNHFFPESAIPEVIYYQSAWNNNISCSDSAVGISLDTYLGYDNKVTQQLSPEAFPNYKKQNMDEKYIHADVVKGWAAFKFGHYYERKDLLSELIFYGKLMYTAEALAPEIPDSIMMSWSTSQMKWAEGHEWNTWKALANEKVMYQSKGFEIAKWFADGPFTGAIGIPQDSPPQLGVWIGWKIVRDFMSAHPEMTPAMLWEAKENQKILSAFKPKH